MEHEDKMTIKPLSEFEIKQVQASCWADGTDVIKADRLRELFAELLKEQYGWLNSKETLTFSVDVEKCRKLFAPLIKKEEKK
jgi:hypothetical protein